MTSVYWGPAGGERASGERRGPDGSEREWTNFESFSRKLVAMERICSRCHAEIAPGIVAAFCPACGGVLLERLALEMPETKTAGPAAEVDRRGIVLPRRHVLGGIITPQ